MHVSVTQEKNDLALQLQAVSRGGAGFLSATWCPLAPSPRREPQAAPRKYHNQIPGRGGPGVLWVLRPRPGLSSYSGGSWACARVQPPTFPTSPPSLCMCPNAATPCVPVASCKATGQPHLPSSPLPSIPETVACCLLWLRATGTQAAGNSNNRRVEIKGPDPHQVHRAIPSFSKYLECQAPWKLWIYIGGRTDRPVLTNSPARAGDVMQPGSEETVMAEKLSPLWPCRALPLTQPRVGRAGSRLLC